MRFLHRNKSAPGPAFFSVLTLVATGCGLSVAGELVVDGGAPAEGQASDDATVSISDATDSGTGMAPGNLDDSDDSRTDSLSGAAPPQPPLRRNAGGDPDDAGDRDAAEGAEEAGHSSKGTPACPIADDASVCDVGTNITLDYECAATANATQEIKPWFKITNKGTMPQGLNELTVRYWYDVDSDSGGQSQAFV